MLCRNGLALGYTVQVYELRKNVADAFCLRNACVPARSRPSGVARLPGAIVPTHELERFIRVLRVLSVVHRNAFGRERLFPSDTLLYRSLALDASLFYNMQIFGGGNTGAKHELDQRPQHGD